MTADEQKSGYSYTGGTPGRTETVQTLVLTALFAAIVAVATSFFRIPTLATQGYIHLGDAMVYISVIVLGKKYGAAASAIGSGLADLLGGYVYWAPWTILIKGVMALIFGAVSGSRGTALKDKQETGDSGSGRLRRAGAYVFSGALMVLGYYIAAGVMAGNFAAPLATVPWNVAQGVVGALIAELVSFIMARRA